MGKEKNCKKTLVDLFHMGSIEEFKEALFNAGKLKDGDKEEENFNMKQKCLLTFEKIKYEEMKKQTSILADIRSNTDFK